jgi:hypothetical protein
MDEKLDLNVRIPASRVTEILKTLMRMNGELLQLTRHNGIDEGVGFPAPRRRRYPKVPAREVVLAALKGGSEVHRQELSKALHAQGHAATSIGPITTMLKKEGKITTPRRGFWKAKKS